MWKQKGMLPFPAADPTLTSLFCCFSLGMPCWERREGLGDPSPWGLWWPFLRSKMSQHLPGQKKKRFGEPALEPGKFLPWSLGGGERLMGGGPRHPLGMGTVLLLWEEALEHLCKPSVPQSRANLPKNPHSPQAGGKERWAGKGSSLFLRALQQMLLLRRKWGQNVDLSNFLHLPLPCQQPWNSRCGRERPWLGTGSL